MSYAVVLLREFTKQFRRHPKSVKFRVRQRVIELGENPYLGIRLVGELSDYWKDRVGKYRLLYKIDESRKMIVIYDVDLRKRVYE